MELVSIFLAVLASVTAALLSRKVRNLWIREAIVIAVAYVVAYTAFWLPVKVVTHDDQTASWAPLIIDAAFYIGAVLGTVALLVSHWLIKPRRSSGS